jgi:hypothetical protein
MSHSVTRAIATYLERAGPGASETARLRSGARSSLHAGDYASASRVCRKKGCDVAVSCTCRVDNVHGHGLRAEYMHSIKCHAALRAARHDAEPRTKGNN